MLKFLVNIINFQILSTLPSKFDIFCTKQYLVIRKPKYVLPYFKNEFVRKGFHYNLIIINNIIILILSLLTKLYRCSIPDFVLNIEQYELDSYMSFECCYVCSRR